jgi:hypothetical protein
VPDPDHSRTLEALREEFRLAKKAFDNASDRFDAVNMDPRADSTQRIKAASRELDSARERFMKAVARLSEFTASGQIPEELDQPPKK